MRGCEDPPPWAEKGHEMRTAFLLSVVLLLFGTIGCSENRRQDMASTDSQAEVSVEGEGMPGEDLMRGLFTYMADAALFEDCASGQRYPVAMEADYISAERVYLEARSEPGAPLLVSFRVVSNRDRPWKATVWSK